jgi:RNA polymerase sigma factor (sigma-70 family)
MVLGVCRRVLNNLQDSEDAFQATFLVLVRKAGAIQRRALLGNWLYGVACRTARRARAMNIRRQKKEREAPHRKAACTESQDTSPEELLRHLDTELSRLPDKYRIPVVLCELEGKSRKEAARLLGLAEGTLSWRLAWARKLLGRRMARHGVALSAAGLAASLSGKASAAVPLTLLNSTAKVAMQAAAGRALTAAVASAQVITLTEGVLKAMLLSKMKVIWTVVLVVAVGAGVSGLTYRAVAAEPGQPSDPSPQARGESDELEALRLEMEALRRGLQAPRERVKSLEGEVQTLKTAAAQAPRGMTAMSGAGSFGPPIAGFPGTGSVTFGQGLQPGAGMPGFIQRGGGVGGFRVEGTTPEFTRDAGGKRFGLGGGGLGGAPGQGVGSTEDPLGSPHSSTLVPRPPGRKTSKSQDPLVEAESALKELKQNPDSKPAMARLDRALLQLKKQAEPEGADAKPEPKP